MILHTNQRPKLSFYLTRIQENVIVTSLLVMVQETATCFYCENMKTTFSCAESFIDLLAHTQDFGKRDQSQSSPTTGGSGGSMTGKPEQPRAC